MERGLNESGKNRLTGIEDRLSSLLKPVTPDPDFIDSLKSRLTRTPELILETGRRQINFLTVTIGLATGALIYWVIRRFMR